MEVCRKNWLMTGTATNVSKGRVLKINDYGNLWIIPPVSIPQISKATLGEELFSSYARTKPSICAACRHRVSQHLIPEDLNEILIKRQSCTCRHLWQFLSAEFVKGGSVTRYVRSRAGLLILGVFFLTTRIALIALIYSRLKSWLFDPPPNTPLV